MKILAVYALEEERIELEHTDWIVTGIGKTAAAFATTKAILDSRPSLVLNIGTAGALPSSGLAVGDVAVARRFIDRNYVKLRDYGVEHEVTSLSAGCFDGLCSLVSGHESRRDYVVNTGDDFVTHGEGIRGDVVDMEGFAVACCCLNLGVPMLSVKYVTDIVGENSVVQWSQRLQMARGGLAAFFDKYASLLEDFV